MSSVTKEQLHQMTIEQALRVMVEEVALPEWKCVRKVVQEAPEFGGEIKQLWLNYEGYFKEKYETVDMNFPILFRQIIKGAMQQPENAKRLDDYMGKLNNIRNGKLTLDKANELVQDANISRWLTPVLEKLNTPKV